MSTVFNGVNFLRRDGRSCIIVYSYGGILSLSCRGLFSARRGSNTSVAIINIGTPVPSGVNSVLYFSGISRGNEVARVDLSEASSNSICRDMGVIVVGGCLLRGLVARTRSGGEVSFRGGMLVTGIGSLSVETCSTASSFVNAISSIRTCCSISVGLLRCRDERGLFDGRFPICAGRHSSVPALCNPRSASGGSLITSNYVVSNAIRGYVVFGNAGVTGNTIIGGSVLVRSAIVNRGAGLGCIVSSGGMGVGGNIRLSNTPAFPIALAGNAEVWHF